MADVIFVTPNIRGSASEEPIGTLLLATILKDAGVDVEIVPFHVIGDVKNFENFFEKSMQLLSEKNPKILSFYTRCDTFHIDIKIAQAFKECYPETFIVFGGPQVTLCAEDTVKELPFVDFACCGEGESTIVPFFQSLLENKPDLSIQGLVYLKDGTVIKNPNPPLVQDLDTLPMLDYSFINNGDELKTKFVVDVGRGCPFACSYCSTSLFWKRSYRLKSAERIIEEIKYVHELFGVTNFHFAHDMFTMNKKKVIKTCELINQLDFPITWRCSARTDCLDEELIDIMHESGMQSIFVGIETGSPRMQKLIHKNLKLNGVKDIIQYLVKKGIKVTASFIYGFPEEEPEDISQTIELYLKLSRLKGVSLQMHLCAFLPGTELEMKYKDQLTDFDRTSNITMDYALDECRDLVIEHPNLFTQYREYHTPLREEMRYLEVYLYFFKSYYPIYFMITKKYFSGNYYEAYLAWVERNAVILEKYKDKKLYLELNNNDGYFSIIRDTRLNKIALELKRFIQGIGSKNTYRNEVFNFCVDDYLSDKELSDYENGFTIFNATLKNGKYVTRYFIERK